MLNTEAARIFTTKYNQAQAYMRDFNAKLDTTTTSNIKAYFGIKLVTFIGKLTIYSLVNRINFHIMQTNILFLLCLQDMNRLGIYLNNLKNQVVMKNGVTILIVRIYRHLFLI